MVISFSLEKPLNHLLNIGFVYTFRIKKRKRVGKNWFNDGRLKKKIGNCNIRLELEYDFNILTSKENPVYYIGAKNIVLYQSLIPYQNYSGFESLDEWIDNIIIINKGEIPIKGYVYRVDYR